MKVNFKILFSVMATLLLRGVVIAQFNESHTLKFQMRVSASGSWQRGNVDLLVVRWKLDFVANGNKDLVLKSQYNSLYQQLGDYKADNDINSRNYLYINYNKRFILLRCFMHKPIFVEK